MSRWKKLVNPPEGALPGGLVTKAGVVVIAVLMGGLLLSLAAGGGGGEEAAPPVVVPAQAVGEGMGRSLEDRIRQESERQVLVAAAQARADELQRQEEEGALPPAGAGEEAGTPGASPDPGVSPAEAELRESLRLEEVERRTRSLRSLPLAGSRRDPDAGAVPPGPAARETGDPPPAGDDPVAGALEAAFATFGESGRALEYELAAEERLLAALGGGPPVPGPAGAPPESPFRAPSDPLDPARLVRPSDPPGWERIHEGSFLEAVLVTQLTGEFPGPVLAMVSVPFRSADRQRVLIPRGTRAVGTAQAVRDRDQSRLAVAFHRLVLPDGSWIGLEFDGLNQAGESALMDEVDRHYFSTFAAAGAVGILSGLTLAGAPAYGLQAGVGQGLGQGALQILDRFLNRLPTITIRAGHRLRIWFTSDALVPRPGTRP
ncbi:MAG: TrbI/VirB10 family protein [Gammaproteobacteria bacterium]|nr:TrbI/VirB10 family protein [Gammaproteobacteria bacterium]MDE0249288.1 TrbI/VirB10 family protein [Gammaproteobacteria bacterium]